MDNKFLLGIDAGTSSIKAVLFNINGKKISDYSIENEVIESNVSWTEQDMNLLWAKMCSVVKGVINKTSINPADIKAVGITGQGEGCWLLDKDNNPSRNAILWSDGRTADYVASIQEKTDVYNKIKKITGSFIFPGATSIILKWLMDNEPQIINKAHRVLFCKDWLRYKLTGNIFLDITDASTSLLDLKSRKISKELLELLGIEKLYNLFPEILNPCDIAGYITEEASKETGLACGTIVSAGMMDIVASATGAGALKKGDICTILGTTCCNEIVKEEPSLDSGNLSGFECHSAEGLYLNVIAPMAATPNIDWILKNLCKDDIEASKKEGLDTYSYLENKMKEITPGCNGVIYHPYISPAGERAPFLNLNAKAQFFGISGQTTKYHLLRAVYEGIAFSIKDCLSGADNGRIYLTGGGSKSFFWAQIISDVTGREVVSLEGDEYPAKGAALSAAVAAGIYKTINESALKTTFIKKVFYPQNKYRDLYDSLYGLYVKIREKNNELWNLRRSILDEHSCK